MVKLDTMNKLYDGVPSVQRLDAWLYRNLPPIMAPVTRWPLCVAVMLIGMVVVAFVPRRWM